MLYSVVTIFPDLIRSFCQYGLIAKSMSKNIIHIDTYDLRDYCQNKHRKVDDRPFGGGPGMVMMPAPFFRVVQEIKKKKSGRVILLSAYGTILNQKKAKKLATFDHLIILCGRYEGVDQRIIDHLVNEEISIGKYVLMGGEIAAMAVIESVSRMIPNVIGNPISVQTDSFFLPHQLNFPQYTQPQNFNGLKVPEILLSGNHKKIDEWRLKHQKRKIKKSTSK